MLCIAYIVLFFVSHINGLIMWTDAVNNFLYLHFPDLDKIQTREIENDR